MAKHKQPGSLGYIESQQFIIRGSKTKNTQTISRLFPNVASQMSDLTSGRRCYDFEEWLRGLEDQDLTVEDTMFFGESDSLSLARSTDASTQDVLALFRVYLAAKVKNLIFLNLKLLMHLSFLNFHQQRE